MYGWTYYISPVFGIVNNSSTIIHRTSTLNKHHSRAFTRQDIKGHDISETENTTTTLTNTPKIHQPTSHHQVVLSSQQVWCMGNGSLVNGVLCSISYHCACPHVSHSGIQLKLTMANKRSHSNSNWSSTNHLNVCHSTSHHNTSNHNRSECHVFFMIFDRESTLKWAIPLLLDNPDIYRQSLHHISTTTSIQTKSIDMELHRGLYVIGVYYKQNAGWLWTAICSFTQSSSHYGSKHRSKSKKWWVRYDMDMIWKWHDMIWYDSVLRCNMECAVAHFVFSSCLVIVLCVVDAVIVSLMKPWCRPAHDRSSYYTPLCSVSSMSSYLCDAIWN